MEILFFRVFSFSAWGLSTQFTKPGTRKGAAAWTIGHDLQDALLGGQPLGADHQQGGGWREDPWGNSPDDQLVATCAVQLASLFYHDQSHLLSGGLKGNNPPIF